MRSLKTVDLSLFNTNNVTNMGYMLMVVLNLLQLIC